MTEINQNSHLVAQSDNSSSYDESSVYAESQDAEVPNENNSVTSDDVVAKHETAAVTRLKLAVLLVLVGSTLAIALSVFFYLSNIEESQFNKQFRDDSHKVMESIGSTLDKTLASYDGLAMTLISHAEATNQSWPFVTLPDFAARLSKVLPLSDAVNINVVPLVTQQQRTKWEQYSVEHDYWVNENMHFQKNWDRYYGPVVFDGEPNTVLMGDFGEIPRNESIHLPVWQNFPVLANNSYTYNFDWLSISDTDSLFVCLEKQKVVITMPYMIPTPGDEIAEAETEAWAEYYKDFISPDEEAIEPMSDLLFPILDTLGRPSAEHVDDELRNHTFVGMIAAQFYWRAIFRNILPRDSNGIYVVMSNPCSGAFTYKINGPSAQYVGPLDRHETKYDGITSSSRLQDLGNFAMRDSVYLGVPMDSDYCPLMVHLYPSDEMHDDHTTSRPIMLSISVVLIFAFTSLVFFFYDAKVERRQQTVMTTAVNSSALVSSLFPAAVRDQLYASDLAVRCENASGTKDKILRNTTLGDETSMKSEDKLGFATAPIAELYPDTTVLFADIVGFTAWSSEREPTQVFTLLETLYAAFDGIAKQRGVFKVETIGDCYVAVVGLPTPRKHHAVVMARFANDCRKKMHELTAKLETLLGLGTADLSLRLGLNSGATTAGVLRGEKSRFQLFGDTVNTAARMESSGEQNKIHVSEKTAMLISQAGKAHWLIPREAMVECKGKGKMKTFWCDIKSGPSSTVSSSNKSFASEESCESISAPTCKKLHVEWIVDVFTKLLKDILMERNAELDSHDRYNNSIPEYSSASSKETLNVLTLPLCKAPRRCEHALSQRDSVVVPTDVAKDMHKFITSIADLHRPNDEFRSLNHSCHTVMSTLKLLHWTEENGAKESSENIGATSSHVYFGPLAKFAVVLGALIQHVAPQTEDPSPVERQDISHPSRRSSAEAENAIAKVWQLLTQEPNQFLSLRRCLCSTTEEWHRFRQVLVHASLSTVVMDANVESMRTSRWETFLAMSKNSSNDQSDFSGGRIESKNSTVLGTKEQISATLAIDLIVQASYFSHGMQHWSVYQKWNRIMWSEQYKAFCLRLCNTDPASVWFEHELQFLDGTVLPLITKLKDCGFFGAASYEGLWDYAVGNRDEWARNGRDIVCEESKGWQGDEGDNDDDHRRAYV